MLGLRRLVPPGGRLFTTRARNPFSAAERAKAESRDRLKQCGLGRQAPLIEDSESDVLENDSAGSASLQQVQEVDEMSPFAPIGALWRILRVSMGWMQRDSMESQPPSRT